MSKVRVDELATELGLGSEELFSQLKAMGFDVVNVTSSVDRSLFDTVRDMLVEEPAEREEGPRRIVSVRKGESELEVEVRLEEELAEELEVLPEDQGEEIPPLMEMDPADTAGDDLKEADETVSEEETVDSVEQEMVHDSGEESPVEDPEQAEPVEESKKSKLGKLPLTALELEKDLGAVGSEIPKAKVVVQAPVKGVEKEQEKEAEKPPGPAEETSEKKAKVQLEMPEEQKKSKRAARKPKKQVVKELLEEIEEMETDEETPEELVAVEEPTLKVVEIKHATSGQQARRREPPKRKLRRPKRKTDDTPRETVQPASRNIRITQGLTVGDLAGMTGTKASEIIKILLQLGIMATINETVEPETASLVVSELGFEVDMKSHTIDDLLEEEPAEEKNLVLRPPIITVMGHVDHGKTSLLDAVRETDVVSGEAGGITQHIGAHMVHHTKGQLVFLDTPGHEAFTAMRARGAHVTDLVVLVVAADDGVKPQTVEAIDHAKAANVPLVVAINKIDKPEADPDRVIRELSDHGVVPEDWGGDVLFTQVSAKQKTGIDDLLDLILLQAEVLELKADPDTAVRGTVIESRLDRGRGPVATVLVQRGTLRTGSLMVAGAFMGRVRAMTDDRGRKLDTAGPSTPVEVVGLQGVPAAGEPFAVFSDEVKAKRVAQMREEEASAIRGTHKKVTLEDLFTQIQDGVVKDLNVVLKADVQGSVEAIKEALFKQSTDEVRVRVIHEGAGGINEGDVMLAVASSAIILGFNVRPDNKALEVARKEKVDVRFYKVIYDVIKEIRDALKGLLSPVYSEEILGRAEIRETFVVPKIGTIAGCYVTDGTIKRNAQVRVIRDGIVVNDGKIDSLRRFKDDVREVATEFECGIGLENYNDVKVGDVLENYEIIAQEAEL
jgi:translation initiation factor IF-2